MSDPGVEYRSIRNETDDALSSEEHRTRYRSALMNKKKNRYMDVLPYEHTRIRLNSESESVESETSSATSSSSESDQRGDYINASLLNGILGSRYVATQAPLPDTRNDFWQMVWEQGCSTIVMLTRMVEAQKVKAVEYWPMRVGEEREYGRHTVTLIRQRMHPCGHICVRIMRLAKRNDCEPSRIVTHLHYTEWPDYGLPDTTAALRVLVHLTNSLHTTQRSHVSKRTREGEEKRERERDMTYAAVPPVVVHCSAGIGRAGTFIAIHQTIRQIQHHISVSRNAPSSLSLSPLSSISPLSSPPLSSPPSPLRSSSSSSALTRSPSLSSASEGEQRKLLSIRDIVISMRQQRRGMVQTKEQYCFIYRVAFDALKELLHGSSNPLHLSWNSESREVEVFLRECQGEEKAEDKCDQISIDIRKTNLSLPMLDSMDCTNDGPPSPPMITPVSLRNVAVWKQTKVCPPPSCTYSDEEEEVME